MSFAGMNTHCIPESQNSSQWLPLMEYATQEGVSLSTLRRYIKANKIQHRIENGRYLVLKESSNPKNTITGEELQACLKPLIEKINELETSLSEARNEITEVKTMMAFYEEQIPNRVES